MARRIVEQQSSLFSKVKGRSSSVFSTVRSRISYKKITAFIQKRPFVSFFIALFLLLALIVLGSTIFAPKPVEEKKFEGAKEVQTFKIGSAPKVTFQAQVEKSGVIKVAAQMPGIVSAINVTEGDVVTQGKGLVSLSSNYSGGNAAGIQAQIAQNQYNLVKDTYDTQKDLIAKQRQVAEKTDANADELRDIAARSIDETRGLLDLNQSNLDALNASLTVTPPADPATLAQAQAQKAQLQAAVNQLRSALRQTEYQASGDKPPAQLSDLGRDIALKQLDVQEKTLEAGKETARLSAALASVTAAQMYPVAPFTGVVQRVHVQVGQQVNPGTPLITISGVTNNVTVVANVPQSIAKNISKLEESAITVNGKTISVMPSFVTTDAINGQQYGVIYQLGAGYSDLFTDGAYVSVAIPVGTGDTTSVVPQIPVDSIFQTQDEAYVFVDENGVAKSKKVKLGEVSGSFVAIEEGLSPEDTVIISRSVVDGDKVSEAH